MVRARPHARLPIGIRHNTKNTQHDFCFPLIAVPIMHAPVRGYRPPQAPVGNPQSRIPMAIYYRGRKPRSRFALLPRLDSKAGVIWVRKNPTLALLNWLLYVLKGGVFFKFFRAEKDDLRTP